MRDNGIITNANLAKISTEFAGYKEEVEIQGDLTRIGDYAFDGASNLYDITIPFLS